MKKIIIYLNFFITLSINAQSDNWNKEIKLPKSDLHKINDNLDLDERKAINSYTSGKYEGINGFLRGSQPGSPEIIHLIDLISSGLAKLPSYRGKVYRYVNLSNSIISNKYVKGTNVRETFFVSSSITREGTKIDSFMKLPLLDKNKTHVLFMIESIRGKEISLYSVYPFEKEVLFDKNTTFNVTNVIKQNGYVQINLRELSND